MDVGGRATQEQLPSGVQDVPSNVHAACAFGSKKHRVIYSITARRLIDRWPSG